MSAFTSKVMQVGRAPKRIELLGEKTKRPESAQHVIEFPGGAIELSRTSKGEYWAHIIINRGEVIDDADGLVSAQGQVIGSRVGRTGAGSIDSIEREGAIEQIAVLIRTVRAEAAKAVDPEPLQTQPELFACASPSKASWPSSRASGWRDAAWSAWSIPEWMVGIGARLVTTNTQPWLRAGAVVAATRLTAPSRAMRPATAATPNATA